MSYNHNRDSQYINKKSMDEFKGSLRFIRNNVEDAANKMVEFESFIVSFYGAFISDGTA